MHLVLVSLSVTTMRSPTNPWQVEAEAARNVVGVKCSARKLSKKKMSMQLWYRKLVGILSTLARTNPKLGHLYED